MSWDGIVVFAIAYAIVVISPGPGLASFIGQILGHGIKAAPAQALGIYAGDLVWYGLAATGLAALALGFALFTDAVRRSKATRPVKQTAPALRPQTMSNR